MLHYDTIIPDEKNDIVFKGTAETSASTKHVTNFWPLVTNIYMIAVGEDEQLTLRQTVATFIKLALDKTRAKAGEVYKDVSSVSASIF